MNVGDFGKRALLTGAGSSKSWGGLLAEAMRFAIFNNVKVQQRPLLKTLLQAEKWFEVALDRARTNPAYTAEDVAAIEDAIEETFKGMDQTFQETVDHGTINAYVVNAFLDRFRSSATQTAYLFTLNQDTLIERIWGKKPEQPPLTTPGVQNYPITDRSTMTISTGLLAWYYKAFEAVLRSGGVRFMVIGYSLSDAHINEAISKAADDHGLRLYILNPSDPFETLAAKPHGSKLLSLNAVNAVWRHSLGELLPSYGVEPSWSRRPKAVRNDLATS
jgi:hypothetical protein